MKELVGRLSALDPDAGAAVQAIAYFDRLVETRAGLEAIVRGAAVLAGCPARLVDADRRVNVRVLADGLREDGDGPPDRSWPSTPVPGGAAELWLERSGPAGPVDAMVLERAASAARNVLDRTRGRAPAAPARDDPALVEVLLDGSASAQIRLQAARGLGLRATTLVRAVAMEGGEARIEAAGILQAGAARTGPPGTLEAGAARSGPAGTPKDGRTGSGATGTPQVGGIRSAPTGPPAGSRGRGGAAGTPKDGGGGSAGSPRGGGGGAAGTPRDGGGGSAGSPKGGGGRGGLAGGAVEPSPPVGERRAGIGPAVPVLDLPASWPAARVALRLAAEGTDQDPGPRVVYADELGGLAVLAAAVGPGTEPVPDVRALEHAGSAAPWMLAALHAVAFAPSLRAAAVRLTVHHSTLQERLAHAEYLLGWSVRDPQGRLRLQLAFALRRLHRHPEPT